MGISVNEERECKVNGTVVVICYIGVMNPLIHWFGFKIKIQIFF